MCSYERKHPPGKPSSLYTTLPPQRGSHIAAQRQSGAAQPRSAALGYERMENTSPEGAQQAPAHRTSDACGMNRFVSPFQGYRAESNPYPGRRSAAVAATLCLG